MGCIVGLEEVVRGRLMRERRHGRVAIPGRRGGVVQAGVNGRYASRWVPVFVVDLHDSGEGGFGGSALIAGPSARHGCPRVSRGCANLNSSSLL